MSEIKTPRKKASAATLAKLKSTATPACACAAAAAAAAVAPAIKTPVAKPVVVANPNIVNILRVKEIALVQTQISREFAVKKPVKVVPTKASEIAKSIAAAGNLCSGAKRDVIGILTAVTGEPIATEYAKLSSSESKKEFSSYFKPGSVVVPLVNKNSHSYDIGKPCMVTTSDMALRMCGTEGNHIPDPKIEKGAYSIVRPATPEELERFFKYFLFLAEEDMLTASSAKCFKELK